ncbi:LysR family transcriptional regulator [Marinobacterium jannaschii]|uniref:LysR family transcriptional regulator n=1 Tax=Marinobacterium jannaschii TaxID=64970 RepID=UPI000AEA123C|nr:LysR family transcriptional regulator [Marinobacterium jannaschii]
MAPDLEALRVLIAIVDSGSFAAAARYLHKTQSAVSYQLAKLEQQLGCELFDRSGYRAALTPVGERLTEEARKLLRQAESVSQLVHRISAGWEPQLKLITDGMLPIAPLLGLLKQMGARDIPTRVLLRVEFLSGVQRRFTAEDADMMLTLEYKPDSALTAIPLKPVEAVLVAVNDHPLAQQSDISLAQLQQQTELTVADSGCDDASGGSQTFGSERIYYLSDFNAKYQALRMGAGYGWMPLALVADDLESGLLVELDSVQDSRITYRPQLVFPALAGEGRAACWLRHELSEIFA